MTQKILKILMILTMIAGIVFSVINFCSVKIEATGSGGEAEKTTLRYYDLSTGDCYGSGNDDC